MGTLNLPQGPKRIFIIGGGPVGSLVARQLESVGSMSASSRGFDRCQSFRVLEKTILLNWPAWIKELLEEGFDRADLVIAVTGDDDVNIPVSLLAKHHGTASDNPHRPPGLHPCWKNWGSTGPEPDCSPRHILKFVRRGLNCAVANILRVVRIVLEMVVPKAAFPAQRAGK